MTGIADSDLVIYVTYGDDDCGDDTLAYAQACNLDQYGRPIAGVINFCSSSLEEEYWKFDVMTTLHEITHILVMSTTLFEFFYDYDAGQFKSDTTTTSGDNTWVITDKVKEITRDHFDCSTLIGAPLESLEFVFIIVFLYTNLATYKLKI